MKMACENGMSKKDKKLCYKGNIWVISLKHKLRLNMTSSCDNAIHNMITQEKACGNLFMQKHIHHVLSFLIFFMSMLPSKPATLESSSHDCWQHKTLTLTRDEAQYRN